MCRSLHPQSKRSGCHCHYFILSVSDSVQCTYHIVHFADHAKSLCECVTPSATTVHALNSDKTSGRCRDCRYQVKIGCVEQSIWRAFGNVRTILAVIQGGSTPCETLIICRDVGQIASGRREIIKVYDLRRLSIHMF